jgi:hypothetical protein
MGSRVYIRWALLLFASAAVFAADITGKWAGQMSGPNGDGIAITFEFKQDGTKLTGTADGPGGQILQITNGKIVEDKLSFTVSFDGGGGEMKILHEGTLSGEEIKLSIKFDGRPDADGPSGIVLKRAK